MFICVLSIHNHNHLHTTSRSAGVAHRLGVPLPPNGPNHIAAVEWNKPAQQEPMHHISCTINYIRCFCTLVIVPLFDVHCFSTWSPSPSHMLISYVTLLASIHCFIYMGSVCLWCDVHQPATYQSYISYHVRLSGPQFASSHTSFHIRSCWSTHVHQKGCLETSVRSTRTPWRMQLQNSSHLPQSKHRHHQQIQTQPYLVMINQTVVLRLVMHHWMWWLTHVLLNSTVHQPPKFHLTFFAWRIFSGSLMSWVVSPKLLTLRRFAWTHKRLKTIHVQQCT